MQCITAHITHSPSAARYNQRIGAHTWCAADTQAGEHIVASRAQLHTPQAYAYTLAQRLTHNNLLRTSIQSGTHSANTPTFTRIQAAKTSLLQCITTHTANCREFAEILFLMLITDPSLPEWFRNHLQIVSLCEPDDHVFLQCCGLIIDPWSGHLHLPKKTGYRAEAVPAKAAEIITDPNKPKISTRLPRTRGYIGDATAYWETLNEHADGHYVRHVPSATSRGSRIKIEEELCALYRDMAQHFPKLVAALQAPLKQPHITATG